LSKTKGAHPEHYFHPVSAGSILSRVTLEQKSSPALQRLLSLTKNALQKMKRVTLIFYLLSEIPKHISNTKMDDLIRGKDHPLFCFNKHEFIFLEI
jgi:hypothetical protein